MFCYQCGAKVADGASFCMQCGARLQAPEQPTPEMTTCYQMPYYAPETPQQPPRKPINKKKLALSVVSVLLCLALVASITLYFTVFATAERKLRNAAEDSVETLENLLGEGTALVDMLKDLKSFKDEFTITVSSDDVAMSLAYSVKKEILSLLLDTSGRYVQFAADNEKLILAFPGRTEESYSIPLAEFGRILLNSSLGSEIPSEARSLVQDIELHIFDVISSVKSLKDEEFFKEFKEMVHPEKVDTSIPHSRGVETVYRQQVDMADYMRFLKKYSKHLFEPILGEQLTAMLTYSMSSSASTEGTLTILYGLDEEDRLVAFHTYTEDYGASNSFTLTLTGNGNPWEQVEFYTDDELAGTLSIKREGEGFAIYADEECILRADGEKLVIGSEGETVTIYYEAQQGGYNFTAENEGNTIELEILPKCETEMPTGKIVDLFSLSRVQIEALAKRFTSLFK